MKSVVLILLLLAGFFNCAAQADSSNRLPQRPAAAPGIATPKPDSAASDSPAAIVDSAAVRSERMVEAEGPVSPWFRPSYIRTLLEQHPYFNFFGNARAEVAVRQTDPAKDGLFYLFIGLVLYFACIRLIFGKYLHNLFTVFFRVSLKQKQLREQLIQSPLPSLLLNVFFIIAGGIFISLLFKHYNYLEGMNLWYLMLYSTGALCVVYLLKFMVLKLMGWIFYIREAADTYIFAVFLVNKLLGIFLIPFLILMAFSAPSTVNVLIMLAFVMIAIFFAYRYIISYAPVMKEIKVSQFHFILYLCGFEVIPLLLIYKVLISFLERST